MSGRVAAARPPPPVVRAAERRVRTGAARGVTLIELLAVMAIIAILALMAVPLYSDRIIRDQVIEAAQLAEIAKKPIAAAWAATQTLPADNAAAGLPVPEKVVSNHVRSLTVQGGAIHIEFGNQANGTLKGKVLSLRPAVVDDAPVVPVAWVCGYAPAPEKMSVQGGNRTDVPRHLLPVNCR